MTLLSEIRVTRASLRLKPVALVESWSALWSILPRLVLHPRWNVVQVFLSEESIYFLL